MRYTTLTKQEPVGRLFGDVMRQSPVVPVLTSTKGTRSEPILSLETLTRRSIPSNIRRIEPRYTGIVPSTLTRSTPGHLLPPNVTRSVIPAILGTPSIPVSTASTGGAATPQATAPTSGLGGGLGSISTQLGGGLTNIGSSISKTTTDYLPLAIKVIIGVIVIKIVLWLVQAGGRR